MIRAIILILIVFAGFGAPEGMAQSIPIDSLARIVVELQLDSAKVNGRCSLDHPCIHKISSSDEFHRLVQGGSPDTHGTRFLGLSREFAADDQFWASILAVSRRDLVATVLNDLVGFEDATAFVALWERDGDVLTLSQIYPDGFSHGIGWIVAERYAVFPDGSVLLVLRTMTEGVFHKLDFLHIDLDGTFERLLRRRFYYDSGRPTTPYDSVRGLGYHLSESFQSEPVVHLTGLRKSSVSLYGNGDAIDYVLDEDADMDSLNLWHVAQGTSE